MRHSASIQLDARDGLDAREASSRVVCWSQKMMCPMKSAAGQRRRRQAEQLMAGLEPARMPRLVRGHHVLHGQKRDRVRIFEARQVEIAEEHDVGIQDAVALMGQGDGRGDLQELLDVPAAHRLGAQRPPELPPLALDDARQRPQPVGQEGRSRNNDAALARQRSEQRHVAVGHQQIVLRERGDVAVHALAKQRADLQVAPVSRG